ncbi:formate dehydrogenase accessory sulfurtransferase FdhD [Acidovorax sp. sic0104]|uniref:formate dehydrogenase accessory sulfurtransferase FdhD n=1 Tax=Acidovorax sp. sic0104 TaxID=2854784 RepID=UPI001C49798B|nr:formate dehydrogenase accessory sulfurtransferase FdhD [Acidovorax sp. sic0104]MBV7539500.1 formate dehydrogenase accessory sulfurtransferase FdhD [Acidovorax sp. sic0104]
MTSSASPDSAPLALPRLTRAQAPLTHGVEVVNELGEREQVSIPAERPLTVYVDKRELVTLMTLGAHPELLVLGYLRNQRLVESVFDIESITVDWDVHAAAVRTRHGIDRIEERTASKVVTTGCGQGSVFGGLMDEVDRIVLPEARLTQAQLYGIVNAIRLKESTYKSAGSVHGCALFQGEELLTFVEDVGRHNAIDTIAGWMWMNAAPGPVPSGDGLQQAASPEPMSGADKVFYTTGRLTSEMVIKSAQMGVPIVVSRSGMTQMGHAVAQQLGLCAIGRATNRRFVCYSGAERLVLQPDIAQAPAVAPGPGIVALP